jgi:uncharacterized membrane protein
VTIQNYIYVGIRWMIIGITANTWFLVKGLPLESHLMEWLNIIIRDAHHFGIAWIGASFYLFSRKCAQPNRGRTRRTRRKPFGRTRWRILLPREMKIAPKTIPKHLHWFKYEAYFTWLSDFACCLWSIILTLRHS